MFSEKLLGAYAGDPTPVMGGPTTKRGIFFIASSTSYNTGNQTAALQSVQLCNSIPGGTLATPGQGNASWLLGFSWVLGFPWHTSVNRYTHYNSPNKWTCLNPADAGGLWGGADGIVTATSNHPGGVNVCFGDGSVRFVKDSVGLPVWWALGSRNLGETVSSDQY